MSAGRIVRLGQVPWQSIASEAFDHTLLIAKTACCVHVINTDIVSVARVRGPSMIPAFNLTGDVVLMDRITARRGKVASRMSSSSARRRTQGRSSPSGCSDSRGILSISGRILRSEVPKGHVWVQGDNIYDSQDSRQFGPVLYGLIEGRAFLRVWPLEDFGSIRQNSSDAYNHYDEYDSAVAGNDNASLSDEHNPATAGNSNLYDEYDSADDDYISAHPPVQPEVNLKNVFSGIVAILTGRNKVLGAIPPQQDSGSIVDFFGPEVNSVCGLDPSVCAPSAPPRTEQDALDHRRYICVLEENQPEWVPACCAPAAGSANFHLLLAHGRHHCRFCGQIFCRTCTKGRCLLPNKFWMRDPQKVCYECYNKLDPVQPTLRNLISNAAQSAKHDVMDWTCIRGWLNLPIGLSMEHEIYKAANALRSYCQVSRLNSEKSIPQAVLKGASGLSILTVAKAGALITY